jgi:purine-binding chemotaxis protein CheW
VGQVSRDEWTVVFSLGDCQYGIDMGRVQEIISVPQVRRLPWQVPGVLGTVRVGAKVIPLIDLRHRLERESSQPDEQSRVMVVRVGAADAGLLVDRVEDVMRLPQGAVSARGDHGDTEYVQGVASVEDHDVVLLDLDRVLS